MRLFFSTASVVVALLTTLAPLSSANSKDYLQAGLNWDDGQCQTGQKQSPINLISGTQNEEIGAELGTFGSVIVPYEKLTYDDIETGYKNHVPDYYWQVDLSQVPWSSEATLKITGPDGVSSTYDQILRARFHTPAEHSIDGRSKNVEMRLEWRKTTCQEVDKENCDQAALIVFFDFGAGSTENPFLKTFFEAFDDRLTSDDSAEKKAIDFNLLTSEIDFQLIWMYEEGSNTSPPCTENFKTHVIAKKM